MVLRWDGPVLSKGSGDERVGGMAVGTAEDLRAAILGGSQGCVGSKAEGEEGRWLSWWDFRDGFDGETRQVLDAQWGLNLFMRRVRVRRVRWK